MGNFVVGSRDAAASVASVWDLLVDVDRWPETFTPHLKAAHLDGRLQVGATGWVQTKLPLPRSSFVVTSVEEGRRWSWHGKLLWLTMDFDHRCQPTDTGCCVTFDVNLDGPLGSLVRPVARLTYRPQMERALDLLVQQAEAHAA
jgi:hypothetical protein